MGYIRKWDIRTLNRVDYFIANSKFVQERIKKHIKDSVVIYPPVKTDKFRLNLKKMIFISQLVG